MQSVLHSLYQFSELTFARLRPFSSKLTASDCTAKRGMVQPLFLKRLGYLVGLAKIELIGPYQQIAKNQGIKWGGSHAEILLSWTVWVQAMVRKHPLIYV